VNAKLLKRRQDIEELNRVQGLLVKLQVRQAAHPMLARLHSACFRAARQAVHSASAIQCLQQSSAEAARILATPLCPTSQLHLQLFSSTAEEACPRQLVQD
jgi:hypothetical protein